VITTSGKIRIEKSGVKIDTSVTVTTAQLVFMLRMEEPESIHGIKL
jgi:hypothetical protein